MAVVNGGRSRTVKYSAGRIQKHVGSCWLQTVRSSFPDSSFDILVRLTGKRTHGLGLWRGAWGVTLRVSNT